MKTIYSVIFLPFLIIILFVTPVTGSEDWVKYGRSNKKDILSYDKNSIKHTKKDIVQVRTKVDFSKEGRKTYLQFRINQRVSTKIIDKFSYYVDLQEIDCKNKMFRILSTTYYDTDGNLLETNSDDKQYFMNIPDGTVMNILQKKVCKKPKVKGSK